MKATALITGALLMSAPAVADWQYTKWGMTADQVGAASKGQMKRCSAVCDKQTTATSTALLYGPYQSGTLPFTAFAFFDKQTKKLVQMSLRLDDSSKGNELIGGLRAKYGDPVSESKTQVLHLLVWRPAGDQIDLTRIGFGGDFSYTLGYHPRATSSNKGL